MIVGVCSDKGVPGVTTLATVLGLVWPAAVVLEADPAGGDLTFRLRNRQMPAQEFLPADPSVFQLAADARSGLLADGQVVRYAQETTLGVRVVPGPLQAEQFAALRPLWPVLAQELAASPQVVIVDLGRMQPGHPAWAMAQAATVLLVLGRPDPEGLCHLRERVAQLAGDLGGGTRARNPVGAVIRTSAKRARRSLDEAALMLQAAGSPIPVLGWMGEDPAAVAALRAARVSRSLRSSDLTGSVQALAEVLTRLWPELAGQASGAA